jgi:hypothetical protein
MNLNGLRAIDVTIWLAMGCVIVGWFGMSTLVASFGPVQHNAHFYDLAAVMLNPRRLVFGWDSSPSVGTLAFALVSLLIVVLPLLPRLGIRTARWLLLCAPALLMLLCSIVLYIKASSTHIGAPDSMGKVGQYLAMAANGAMDWTGDVVSRHISLGAGAYLSFAGSLWLALRGSLARVNAPSASE